jgi:hypothetical protein
MITRDTITLRPYSAGEIPPALPVHFYEDEPEDLSGFSLAVTCERDGEELEDWGEATWDDAEQAVALLHMPELALPEDSVRAQYEVQVWAGDGTFRLATVIICFPVVRSIGTPPDL